MGNLGFMEIAVILVLALVIFGPQRLPEIARQVGRAIREVRRVSSEFEREVRTNFAIDEHHSTYLTPNRPAERRATDDAASPDPTPAAPDAARTAAQTPSEPPDEGPADSPV